MMETKSQSEDTVMPTSSSLKLVGLSVASLVVVFAAMIMVARWSPFEGGNASHPSDAELEEVFREHEAEFNQLISMSQTDSKVMRIASTFTWLDENASWPVLHRHLAFRRNDGRNTVNSSGDLA
jgi:hypothetical protein